MLSRKQLKKDAVCLDLQATDKAAVMEEMPDLLMATGKVPDRKVAHKMLWAREDQQSTGLPGGVAIPHAKYDSVDSLAVAIGIHRAGVDFEAMDGKPTHFIIMSVSPDNRHGPHIQFLADLSRKLSDPAIRHQLLAAKTAEQVIDALTT